MSPQELQTLQDFLNQLTQVRGIGKDPQADALISAAVAQQPDAAYLLVQRSLLMEQALNSAKAQITSLQGQVQSLQANAAPAPGFFDSNAWGRAPGPAAAAPARPAAPPAFAPAYAPPPAAPVAAQPAPSYPTQAAPAQSSGFFGGGMGNMLGTVAATAAGVAGGAFLFQGIEHLMNSGSGSGHQNALSSTPVENIENTTINNYYGSDDRDSDKNSSQASNDRNDDRNDDRDNDRNDDSASSNDFADISDIDLDDGSGYDDSMA